MKNLVIPILLISILTGCYRHKNTSSEQLATDSLIESVIYAQPQTALKMADSVCHVASDSCVYHAALSYKALAYCFLNMSDSMELAAAAVERFADHNAHRCNDGRINLMLSNVYEAKGIYYSLTKKEDSASIYLKKAIENAQRESIPKMYLNLADSYVRQGNFVKAAEYYRNTLAMNDSVGKVISSFYIYNSLGMVYLQISEYDEAERYLNMSAKMLSEMNNEEQFFLFNTFGNLYYYKKEYPKALGYFKKAVESVDKSGRRTINSYVPVFNEAEIYILLHEADSAKACLDTLRRVLKDADVPVFDAHYRTLRFALALENKDMNTAKRMIGQLESEKLPFELQRIRNRYLREFYKNNEDFRRAYSMLEQNTAEEDSMKSIQVKTRVADIYMRYQQDSTLIAKQNQILLKDNQLKESHGMVLLWVGIAVILGFIAIVVFLIMRRQRERIVARHIENIGRLRMANIRNCLSPHFTFNVLNHEIASFNDTDPHRLQMMALVKILRRSVEVSSHATVTLDEEMDFVNTYIPLECGAWGEDFSYRCDIDPDIDAAAFVMPSMFIQIPVENAIKHGLRAIDGKKPLHIAICKKDGGFAITITNNGIGYQPHLLSSGTGKGLQVIYQTILLLNKRNAAKITFKIGKDNPSNQGCEGTRVEIFIPENYDYSAFK